MLSRIILLLFFTFVSNTITGVFFYYQNLGVMSEELTLYEGSDFLITVTSSLFIDRSLLIEQFIAITKPGTGLLVQAPPKYGKSTNMNMIKRFFSLSLNEKGSINNWKETSNYMLFKNNNLKIYSRREFFYSHFGRYPVIFIDFEPLREVSNRNNFLEVLRIIILQTVEQHIYLKRHLLDKSAFENDPTTLSILANCLHKKYNKKVIVLIDNFDIFMESPLYSENSKIFHLVINIYTNLLKCKSVERSLVTGALPSGSFIDILPSCVVKCGPEHKVWPYFGLTSHELYNLVKYIFPDKEQREKFTAKIVREHSGDVDERNNILSTQITSVWCVTQYLGSEGASNIYDYQEYSLG